MYEAEVIQLADGTYLIVLDNRPDSLGPFSKRELKALLIALLENQEDEA